MAHHNVCVVGVVGMVLGMLLLGQGVDACIPRSEILARAQVWIDRKVPYSQSKTYEGYRTDCSGFVSMSWKLDKPGRTTTSLSSVAIAISKDELKPGDILLCPGSHVAIFGDWSDGAKTKWVCMHEAGTGKGTVMRSDVPYPWWKGNSCYKPYRFKDVCPTDESVATLPGPTVTTTTPETATTPATGAVIPSDQIGPTGSLGGVSSVPNLPHSPRSPIVYKATQPSDFGLASDGQLLYPAMYDNWAKIVANYQGQVAEDAREYYNRRREVWDTLQHKLQGRYDTLQKDKVDYFNDYVEALKNRYINTLDDQYKHHLDQVQARWQARSDMYQAAAAVERRAIQRLDEFFNNLKKNSFLEKAPSVKDNLLPRSMEDYRVHTGRYEQILHAQNYDYAFTTAYLKNLNMRYTEFMKEVKSIPAMPLPGGPTKQRCPGFPCICKKQLIHIPFGRARRRRAPSGVIQK
eukprot:TRINITY_DN1077_c0_g1_i2.p1 TRINITY_DN1077_c0_g1~~TRINITY_DN1077_c0_g1_i2.p1  ORF type:complete len:476 (+),score=68.81 TRINITY_DN1077_c0_g1_i2:45-1430(+)